MEYLVPHVSVVDDLVFGRLSVYIVYLYQICSVLPIDQFDSGALSFISRGLVYQNLMCRVSWHLFALPSLFVRELSIC
jgi:hypothetical protein